MKQISTKNYWTPQDFKVIYITQGTLFLKLLYLQETDTYEAPYLFISVNIIPNTDPQVAWGKQPSYEKMQRTWLLK